VNLFLIGNKSFSTALDQVFSSTKTKLSNKIKRDPYKSSFLDRYVSFIRIPYKQPVTAAEVLDLCSLPKLQKIWCCKLKGEQSAFILKLASHVNIQQLTISSCTISISCLKNLPNLCSLHVKAISVDDHDIVIGNLESLHMSRRLIMDTETVPKMAKYFPNITCFGFYRCGQREAFNLDLSNLPLEKVHLYGEVNLLPFDMSNLRKMFLFNTTFSETTFVGSLSNLTDLVLSEIKGLQEKIILTKCSSNLKTLSLDSDDSALNLEKFQNLSNLRLHQKQHIPTVFSQKIFSMLKYLKIDCEIEPTVQVESLPSLTSLDLLSKTDPELMHKFICASPKLQSFTQRSYDTTMRYNLSVVAISIPEIKFYADSNLAAKALCILKGMIDFIRRNIDAFTKPDKSLSCAKIVRFDGDKIENLDETLLKRAQNYGIRVYADYFLSNRKLRKDRKDWTRTRTVTETEIET
jgi:hypothetical protein